MKIEFNGFEMKLVLQVDCRLFFLNIMIYCINDENCQRD